MLWYTFYVHCYGRLHPDCWCFYTTPCKYPAGCVGCCFYFTCFLWKWFENSRYSSPSYVLPNSPLPFFYCTITNFILWLQLIIEWWMSYCNIQIKIYYFFFYLFVVYDLALVPVGSYERAHSSTLELRDYITTFDMIWRSASVTYLSAFLWYIHGIERDMTRWASWRCLINQRYNHMILEVRYI